MNFLFWKLEHLRTFTLYVVDGLTGGINQQTILTLRHSNTALRLHKTVLLPTCFILSCYHIFRIFDCFICISTHKICTAHNIAVRMNQWRVAAQRIKGIRNRRQLCVVHFHQRRDFVQLFLFIGSDHSQHVSNVAG